MKKTADQALYALAAYCSKAERCPSDLIKKMNLWEIPQTEQAKIMQRLKSEKFFDETRFCRSFINDKSKYAKWGINKIVFELKRKQIPENIYKPLIIDLDKKEIYEQIKYLATKKKQSVKAKDDYDKRNKILRYLLSKGYEMEVSLRVITDITSGNLDDLNDEY